ncbi:glycosyltransferase family 15 protein [Amanita muscaria Koide BX008]|uniref:Glycosyltransferase family 15 protein n=1 Tax=Amanita muscaria (strain Koide BX008) TaxID=946122 RepID=A0A0C2T1R9_AMAMK|nr:glycosyltransferase family 15 protein [Amanita muscaria Koide BX008]
MTNAKRYVFFIALLVISIHHMLGMFRDSDAQLSSLSKLKEQLIRYQMWNGSEPVHNITHGNQNSSGLVPDQRRANATFVFLCRNSDVNEAVSSVQQMEDRFNKRYHYPWVFLNDEPFTDEFKQRISVLTDAPISFGLIQREHWHQPDWIDEDRATRGRLQLMAQGIIYGGECHVVVSHYCNQHSPSGSVPYRNMCRFNSGFFFKHELLQPYRYYWRPGVRYFCDVNYDPFVFMEDNHKLYGFTISLVEWEPTIATLWSAVKEFMVEHPEYVQKDNSLSFLSDNGGNTYNLCHYWSNFEIADMDFWRGEAYQKFFEYLESKGGFYYERWGDAPVHSIAVSLFARKEQVHFFRDIGYKHEYFQHCPNGDIWKQGRCSCDPKDTFDHVPASCTSKYEALFK